MSRIEAVTVPKWGMTMTEGTIVEWLVAEGDQIAKGDEIVEIETTKLANAVEATAGGTLRRIVLPAGTTAPVGALAAVVAEGEVSEDEIDAFVDSYAARAGDGADRDAAAGTRIIQAAGAAVQILESGGTGDEIALFVHGFGGDLTTWMFNQSELDSRVATVALDLPGHGGSDPSPDADAFAGAVAAVLGVVAERGATGVHLIGHSLGGGVAAVAARELGDTCRSVALIAPIGLGQTMSGSFLTEFIAAGRRRPLQGVLERLVADRSRITSEMVERTLGFKRLEGVPEALHAIADSIAEGDQQKRDIREDLAALSCPVALIWGDKDQIVPLPGEVPQRARFETIADAGHLPQMEAATPVNRILLELIDSAR